MASRENAVILIAEDEPLIRMAAVAFVEEAGFLAVEAENADTAIAILESRSDICLVFTDIDMPIGSMNGLKLAKTIYSRWPPIQIILVSGHQVPANDDMPPGSRFYTKPYQEKHLLAAMREMIDAA